MREIILKKRYPHSREEDITDAFMRGYEKGKADRQQEWMPCSERLPKESGQYLVTAGIEQRQVAKGYYSAEYGRWYAVSDVSAWMPLPEPWEGADDK